MLWLANCGNITNVEYRLLFESEIGKAVTRGAPEGRWGVVSPYYV